MFLRPSTVDENVSSAGDGIPSLTRANRAEARCWGARFSEFGLSDPE